MFSPAARDALSRVGYTEGRQFDIAAFGEKLVAEGFTPSPAPQRFLRAFGNLRISIPHPRFPNVTIDFHFDAARAASGIYREKVEPLEIRAGVQLCPIGEGIGSVLLMDPNGAMYAALDDWLVKLGSTPEEGIGELCSGGSGTPVP
jgi:hypothetical protein